MGQSGSADWGAITKHGGDESLSRLQAASYRNGVSFKGLTSQLSSQFDEYFKYTQAELAEIFKAYAVNGHSHMDVKQNRLLFEEYLKVLKTQIPQYYEDVFHLLKDLLESDYKGTFQRVGSTRSNVGSVGLSQSPMGSPLTPVTRTPEEDAKFQRNLERFEQLRERVVTHITERMIKIVEDGTALADSIFLLLDSSRNSKVSQRDFCKQWFTAVVSVFRRQLQIDALFKLNNSDGK